MRLSRRGVPNELRHVVWLLFSGAAALRSRDPTQFQRLLATRGHESTRAAQEIATDLHRSSTHPYYARNAEAHESLRRVLVAYSLRNPQIGYCESARDGQSITQ